jgi:DNA helicase-2/ATP-dependent DNA helicase PcrA
MSTWPAGELLDELLVRARESHDLTPGGVTLATIHAAKGLEWDAVWVVGVVEGQIPSSFARSEDALAEERRLLYVAVSRARHTLVLSHPAKRNNNWRANPSRFLSLLVPATSPAPGRRQSSRNGTSTGTTAATAATAALPASAHCRCGNRLAGMAARTSGSCSAGCLTGQHQERYQRLVQWRASCADQLDRRPDEVATDRAVFTMAVTGSTSNVAGLAADVPAPPS